MVSGHADTLWSLEIAADDLTLSRWDDSCRLSDPAARQQAGRRYARIAAARAALFAARVGERIEDVLGAIAARPELGHLLGPAAAVDEERRPARSAIGWRSGTDLLLLTDESIDGDRTASWRLAVYTSEAYVETGEWTDATWLASATGFDPDYTAAEVAEWAAARIPELLGTLVRLRAGV